MSVRHFIGELSGKKVEGELFMTALYSLITSIATVALLYFAWLRHFEAFNSRIFPLLGFALLSYAFLLPTLRQIRSYDVGDHTQGMMIGMTVGMLAGFLSGFYVGATNGMFVGGVFGLAVGIFFGIWMGKCCGVMGVLEGMMAGFMGGLMGAMTSVMTLNDNLLLMGIVVFAVSLAILVCLWYMVYLGARQSMISKISHWETIAISFILSVMTTMLMTFGPRAIIFG